MVCLVGLEAPQGSAKIKRGTQRSKSTLPAGCNAEHNAGRRTHQHCSNVDQKERNRNEEVADDSKQPHDWCSSPAINSRTQRKRQRRNRCLSQLATPTVAGRGAKPAHPRGQAQQCRGSSECLDLRNGHESDGYPHDVDQNPEQPCPPQQPRSARVSKGGSLGRLGRAQSATRETQRRETYTSTLFQR